MFPFLSFLKDGGKRAPSLAQTAQHFAPLGGSWWDEKGPFAILHQLTPVRVGWLKGQICTHWGLDPENPKALSGLSVVDVGAGGGLITEPLARMGGRVTGLDMVSENMVCAKAHALAQGLDIAYETISLELFSETHAHQKAFDVVVAFEVIEHVDQPDIFIRQAARLLRPGGLLLVSTLNRTFASYALGIVAAEYVLGWVPPGTHSWHAFVTPGDLRWYFKRAGLKPGSFQGLRFSPLRQTWSLSDCLDINYFAAATCPG